MRPYRFSDHRSLLSRATLSIAALFIALSASGCLLGGEPVTQQILEDARQRREMIATATETGTPTPTPGTPRPTPTRTPLPGRSFARVVRVWDGNSILIEGGNSVRYIGADTPGAGMFQRPLEPFGREAAARNVELVEGKRVELEADATDVDSSGMMLRYVYVEGVMVNEVLLEEGLAFLAPVGANARYAARLRSAAEDARQARRYVWTLPTPTPTRTPVPTATRTPTATPTFTPGPTSTRQPTPTLPQVPPAIIGALPHRPFD